MNKLLKKHVLYFIDCIKKFTKNATTNFIKIQTKYYYKIFLTRDETK